ncbi:sugar-binding protein [Gardnerella sp. Marseille-Q2328]|uniref:sugar-binding protein n=1 Tax=Gardnerella sp. Marseille-Q2328 TaxID=2759694 RepID=UPI0020242985|nr:sugar-binding protein [Gardnerella sp. Marseille-Q2328]
MRCDACRCNGAWGGVFVSPAPAYADGYVDGTGNNIYYGFKTDASYSEARFHIEVDYYDTLDNAKAGKEEGKDPLGKFVRVHYLSNCNKEGGTADDWRFRPMWWYGVPKGLQNVQNITYTRVEKLTKVGEKQPFTPVGSSQFKFTNAQGYGQVSQKKYNKPEEWNNISNFYFKDSKVLASKGWKQLLGIDDKGSNGYDNTGNTKTNWQDYQNETAGLQGIFVDWESAGQRFYDMTYVGEMTKEAWENRDVNPLRFAAGVYRFAGNWHYAVGQKHNTPKIADHMKVQYPTQTPVKDKTKLEKNEKDAVKTAIININKDTLHFNELLDADSVNIADDGTATLTFKDKTTLTMPGNLLVVEKKKDNVKFPPVYPAPIGVVNPKSLSDADQQAIIKGFKDANKGKEFLDKVSTTDSEAYKFDNTKHELTITYTDGSTITVPYSSLVYQGATIADWAPYVVPDYTEVDSLTSIKPQEITSIKAKFDDANKDLDVYNKAKAKNKDDYLTINASTGDATIKWEDGSKTVIGAWQFLKEAKKAPAPEPSTPVAEEKTFIVDVPPTQTVVKFDPFKTTSEEINAVNAKTQLDSLKTVLATYVKDSATKQKVDGVTVTYSVDNNGVGQVTFSKQGYTSKTYPMGIFFKNSPQSPASKPTTESKTHTDTTDQKNTFTYNVTKIEYDGEKPTAQDATRALKQFVKDNYDNVSEADLSSITDSVTVKATWIPKTGTHNMGSYDASGSNYGPMMSFSIVGNDFGIKVHGRPWDPDADNGPDWNSSMDMDLFTIKPDELYVKKGGTQHQDNTLADLKKQAKALLKQKRDTEKLSNNDLTRAGIENANKLNDSTIDGMDEKALRKLIAQLTNAKHIERKYNPIPEIEVANPAAPTDEDFKKAIKAFLDANYTGVGDVSSTTYSVTSALKPKPGTADMEPYDSTKNPVGITTISKGTGNKLTVACKDGTSFTVDVTFKKKEDTPAGNDLNKLKEQAKELIDRNPKLTDKQKEEYKNKIDQADTKEKIQNILKEANKQGNDNNVNANDLKEKEKKEKEKREEEKRKEEEKNQLQKDKDKAKETLNTLTNLTDGDSGDKNKLSGEIDKAQTPEDVKKILEKAKAINDARGALKEGALPFLSHGNSSSDDDKALKELIGADITKKDETLTALETAIKDISNAQTSAIRAALDAATRKNGINEQAARQAANAKIAEFENKLEAAEKVLTDNKTIKADDKTKATTDIATAKSAITTAKESVKKATKPSQMLTQLTGVETKFKDADSKVNDAVNNAQKENKKGNTNDPDKDTFNKEKNDAKDEIDKIPGLTKEEKDKYKDLIDHSTHKGDPETFVNQAKKHQKIKDALDKLGKEFEHLNDAQRDAFKKIIEDTDAHDHKDADGKDLGIDDIDVALANAANTDNAMARLEELKKEANDFKNDKDGKYSKLTNSEDDQNKKKAFDSYLDDATKLTTPKDGDAKGAAEVNTLYDDLLKAMRAIDPKVQSAGLKTDALKNEIDSDNKLKPDDKANPKTAGDSVYTTASADKKTAFDKALNEAQTVLNGAKTADISDADKEAAEQNEIDAALDKLIKARLALDGVNTKPLQEEIDKDIKVKDSDRYTYSTTTDKKTTFAKALQAAQDLIDKLTGKKPASADDNLDTKENKQKALDDALAKLKAAEAALDGHAPTPTPTPSVDKSHLQQGINGSGDVKKSDDYNNAPSDKKQAYDHALDHANEVNNNPNATQDQVNQAAEDLKKAEHDLKPTPSVDKSGLQKEIGNEPNVKNSDEYNNAPSDKKQAYDHALDHANEVNKDPHATQDQVNQAAEDLKKAEHDLKPTPTPSVDKSHLQQGINGSDDVHNSDDYTNAPSDKKQAYDHALDHANEVNNNPNATQDQVNQAAEDLKNAQKDLHDSATVDKSHLQSEVSDDVAFRARGSYLVADAPHKDAYNAALSEARRVLADPNATQAQVNAALSKLRETKRNILQANGLSGDEYAGDGTTGTGNTGSETGTGNAGTGAVPGNTGIGNTGSETGTGTGTGVVPGGSSVVPGTVPGSGDSGFGSTGTSSTGTTNSGVAGSGHEGDSSLGFGVNDNAPTTVDKGELNLQIQGAESDSQSANAGNAGVNSGNAGANNAGANAGANAGNAGANNAANAGNAGANAGNAGANNAANAGNAGNAAANNNAAVTAAVENNPAVKQADAQVAAAQAALDSALAEAKKVAANHNATQAQVDAAKRKLADARKNLADAQAHAAQVRASVRAQVLKSGKVAQLSNTGSAVSALSTFAATIAAAGAALFVSKRRGTSRHCSK